MQNFKNNHITKLDTPAFLMNVPFSMNTKLTPNNIWMTEFKPDELTVNMSKLMDQWLDLYTFMASESIVYLLPTPSNTGLQDLVYTANSGALLPHMEEPTYIISNFKTEIRKAETPIIKKFFEQMNFKNVEVCPYPFEGEADLKWIKDNIYIGAYGLRTSREALTWLEQKYGCKIIPYKMSDEYLYHLDCNIFALNSETVLVNTSHAGQETILEMEKHFEIIPMDLDCTYAGMSNSVRLGTSILCSSNIDELKETDEEYDEELYKIDTLTEICSKVGLEPIFFNLSQFFLSGALLSCCVGHLNNADYITPNVLKA